MAGKRIEIADLVKIPFLAGLAPSELEALIGAGRVVAVAPGDLVFRAGDVGSELFVLIDGAVAIELPVAGFPPRLLTTLTPGTVFGEVSFLLGSERTASARAVEPTRALALTRDGLDQALAEGRQAVMSTIETVARILALRLTNADRELAEICGRIRAEHPDAAPLIDSLDDRRRRMQHDWSY